MTRTAAPPRDELAAVPATAGVGMRRSTFRWTVAGLAAFTGLVAIVVSLWIFPYHSQNDDEGVYLTQAAALRAGQMIPQAPGDTPELFQPWFSVLRDGHYVYKSSPVHAGVLAAVPEALGGERAALGVIAALAVVLVVALARELGASRSAALCGGAFFVLSPVVVIQSATYLPYLDGLVFLLAFAVALLRGVRTGSRVALFLAGLAAGISFTARPYDTVVFVAPAVAWVVYRATRGKAAAGLGRIAGWGALGLLPGLAAFFGYNALATGSPFRLPFGLLEPADKIGFGNRRAAPYDEYLPFNLRYAAVATRDNLGLLLRWSFGSVLLVALGVYAAVSRPVLRSRWLLAGWLGAWTAGFFFFWGSYSYVRLWGGGKYLGPYYYLPMIVPLVVAGGIGFVRFATRHRGLAAGFVAVAVAVAGVVIGANLASNLARTRHRTAVADAVASAVGDRRSLVLVPGVWGPFLQHPFSFLRNAADYDGDVVYVRGPTEQALTVVSQHPARSVFAMSLPDGYRDGVVDVMSPMWVDREEVVSGAGVNLEATGRAGDRLRVRVAGSLVDVPFDAQGRARFTLRPAGGGGVVIAHGARELRTGSIAPTDRLIVSVVRTRADGRERELQRREIPVVTSAERVEVMWPGVVVKSRVGPDAPFTWSARVAGT